MGKHLCDLAPGGQKSKQMWIVSTQCTQRSAYIYIYKLTCHRSLMLDGCILESLPGLLYKQARNCGNTLLRSMLHDKMPLDSTFFRSIFFRKFSIPIGYKCISVEIESGLLRRKLFWRWKYRESREIVGGGKWRRPADKGQSIEGYGGRFDEGFAWQRNHWRLRMARDRWWYWWSIVEVVENIESSVSRSGLKDR